MNFSEAEKDAVIWSILTLAESDGSKNKEETWILVKVSNSIGFEVTGLALQKVTQMQNHEVYAILRRFTTEKKTYLKELLESMAISDGEKNHLEENALLHLYHFGELDKNSN